MTIPPAWYRDAHRCCDPNSSVCTSCRCHKGKAGFCRPSSLLPHHRECPVCAYPEKGLKRRSILETGDCTPMLTDYDRRSSRFAQTGTARYRPGSVDRGSHGEAARRHVLLRRLRRGGQRGVQDPGCGHPAKGERCGFSLSAASGTYGNALPSRSCPACSSRGTST